jgi:hypothetical protein
LKKITAILFLSIYLFSATGLNELLEINILVQHFYETKKNDNTVTFLHFLAMHYITDDLNDKDDDRDKQLPFKSIETFISNSVLIYIPHQDTTSLGAQSFAITERIFLITKDVFVLPIYHIPVWHPPKYS